MIITKNENSDAILEPIVMRRNLSKNPITKMLTSKFNINDQAKLKRDTLK